MKELPLKLSLAQWSINTQIKSGELSNLDFARVAKQLGFTGIEYVSQLFSDKAEDGIFLDSLDSAADAAGVEQLLIMIDNEGYIGDTEKQERDKAVDNHKKWVRAASYLGCHSVRVNAFGHGTAEEVANAAIEGLKDLSTYAYDFGINILVENHGHYSSDGKWLVDVIQRVGMDNCGTLPDFGNFCVKRSGTGMWDGDCLETYDKYQGVLEMLPYAKGLSAKSYAFNKEGLETTIDFERMIKLALDSGYKGYIGVEYEGGEHTEYAGIKSTRNLIINSLKAYKH